VYHRPMAGSPDVTAFILAGGKSRRMGRDKAFVDFKGRPLLTRALEVARSVAQDVRIVGGGDRDTQKLESYAPVVEDIFPDRGPLGGIHSALRASRTELNLMLAVDMPFVSSRFLQYLIDEARIDEPLAAAQASVVVPRAGGRRQPLCAIYQRDFADAAEAALRAGRNRIDLLFEVVKTRVLEEEEMASAGFSSDLFRNLNTPQELEEEQRA
jgi:molybdopterin-guanine dinucleotide biosynthesis protein A